jgi:creatinine amidohydrolase
MRFEDLNWFDVEAYLARDDRVMVVTGACEQHGYLSLLTDVRIPFALATAAAQQAGVLVAPPVNFGISPYFTRYPGSLSLSTTTFLAVITDLVRGLHAQGFKRLLFVNGHGGNDPARAVLRELLNALPDLKVDWYDWWLAPAVRALAAEAGLVPNHANWLEAFPFTRVADLPAGDKPPASSDRLLNAAETRDLFGDGVFNGPYLAPDDLMQRIFDAAVADLLGRLRFA